MLVHNKHKFKKLAAQRNISIFFFSPLYVRESWKLNVTPICIISYRFLGMENFKHSNGCGSTAMTSVSPKIEITGMPLRCDPQGPYE